MCKISQVKKEVRTPKYRMRVEKSKKGKGSYNRKSGKRVENEK